MVDVVSGGGRIGCGLGEDECTLEDGLGRSVTPGSDGTVVRRRLTTARGGLDVEQEAALLSPSATRTVMRSLASGDATRYQPGWLLQRR